jgi:hypothetical protein
MVETELHKLEIDPKYKETLKKLKIKIHKLEVIRRKLEKNIFIKFFFNKNAFDNVFSRFKNLFVIEVLNESYVFTFSCRF